MCSHHVNAEHTKMTSFVCREKDINKILLDLVPKHGTMYIMKRKHRRTLELIFRRPVKGSIKWHDIEALFMALGAEVSEREGSRVAVVLFNEVKVFHRSHPTTDTDKGAVASIRKWLESHGVTP